jgi:hypothetical protein
MLRDHVVRPALRAAGLPEMFRTYDLRHTHASLLIDEGANPLEVAQRMGHTDASITLRVYGHLFEGAQQRLTDQLDELRRVSAPATTDDVVTPLRRGQDTHRTQEDTESGDVAVNDGQRRTDEKAM